MRRAGTLTPLCARALGCCNPFAPLEGRGGMGCVCCWGRRCPPSRAGPQWLVLSPIVSGGGAAGTHPATHPDAPTLAPGALVCGRLGPAPPLTPSWAPPTSVTWLIMLPLQRALLSSLLPSSPLPGPAPPSWPEGPPATCGSQQKCKIFSMQSRCHRPWCRAPAAARTPNTRLGYGSTSTLADKRLAAGMTSSCSQLASACVE